MAVIRNIGKLDLLLRHLSGKIGGLVVKRYKDKIVVSVAPKKQKKKRSALQKENQQGMRYAVQFARKVNASPVYRAAWKKQARDFSNVYQAAVSWFLKNRNNRSAVPPHMTKK